MNNRLPKLPLSRDKGCVYVVKRGDAFKIGFTRNGLERRIRDAKGLLVLAIPVKQRPAQFEYLLNNRFADKRLPPQGSKPGDKREWFALTPTDLDWLRDLARSLASTDKPETFC